MQYTKTDKEKIKSRLQCLKESRNYDLESFNTESDDFIPIIEELKRRASTDDICAMYALGCCGEWCLDEMEFKSLTTKGLIGEYLFSMSDNDNAICLASLFKYGIIVAPDGRMAKLLGRAKNITVVETDEEGNSFGYVDTDIFKINFSDKEKDYITTQIQKIADTMPELRRDALYCLTDIYTYYYTSPEAKRKKIDLFKQIYNEFHEDYLLELIKKEEEHS